VLKDLPVPIRLYQAQLVLKDLKALSVLLVLIVQCQAQQALKARRVLLLPFPDLRGQREILEHRAFRVLKAILV
jgi:hypothetical protein